MVHNYTIIQRDCVTHCFPVRKDARKAWFLCCRENATVIVWGEEPVDWHLMCLFLFRQKYLELAWFSLVNSMFTRLECHLFTCCFKSHVFPRAKNRSKSPPANPWARGRGRVSPESLYYVSFLNSFQCLSSMNNLETQKKIQSISSVVTVNVHSNWMHLHMMLCEWIKIMFTLLYAENFHKNPILWCFFVFLQFDNPNS